VLTILNTAAVYAEKDPALWVATVEAYLAADSEACARWIGAIHPDYASLAAEAQLRSGGRIAFPGAKPNADIIQELRQPRRVLLISSSIEVFPMSILEAAREGVPVVTSRFPGHEEVLGSDYPLLFSAVTEGAARVAQVVADYENISRAARRLFQTRFQKDASWYATGDAVMERAGATGR
jgi:glycosyltransferase involved in cell wall biosynthesis